MSTAVAPQAALSVTTDRAVLVPSESTPDTWYHTSAHGCDCAAFYFGRLKDAAYRCKHMIRRFPAMRLCPVCRLNPLTDLPTCVMCGDADPVHARQVALAAAKAPCKHDWIEAGSAEFVCTKCGKVHSYANDEPLTVGQTRPSFYDSKACPGYLREHPAQDGVICHWCPSCDVEALPAARVAA